LTGISEGFFALIDTADIRTLLCMTVAVLS